MNRDKVKHKLKIWFLVLFPIFSFGLGLIIELIFYAGMKYQKSLDSVKIETPLFENNESVSTIIDLKIKGV